VIFQSPWLESGPIKHRVSARCVFLHKDAFVLIEVVASKQPKRFSSS
jgi:hypothetical protein